MAEDYLREVRILQPEGPYLLGGFSGGGVTAFEMAHQLRAQGEEIAGLIMLDAIPPTRPQPGWLDRARIQWQRLTRQGPAYAARWARNRLRWELEKRQPRVARELTPAEFRSGEIEVAFREALVHYRMRAYAGKISLFRPPLDASHRLFGGRVGNAQRELVDPENFWRPWATGEIDVQVVPGDHDAMVLEPSVRVLAARLRPVLEAAQPGKPGEEKA
jgi:thioesterase domain-containing protein